MRAYAAHVRQAFVHIARSPTHMNMSTRLRRCRRGESQARTADVAAAVLPYPQGWFCVGFSSEWRSGMVLTRPFMGQDVVIYRTQHAVLQAVGPYCPHLGAHLGVGGRVAGEELVCPFHNFTFGLDGACVSTPYGAPPKATLDVRPLREINGLVYLWHSHDGAQPDWEIPEHPSRGFHSLVHRTYELAGHPQDVAENVVDYGHITQLHGHITELQRLPIVDEISPPVVDGPFLSMELCLTGAVPLVGNTDIDSRITMYGIGCSFIEASLPRYGFALRAWTTATPIAPWRIHLRIAGTSELHGPQQLPVPALIRRPLSTLATRTIMSKIVKVLTDDLTIYQHKQYLTHPRLVKGDGPIGPFRHWACQFYPRSTRECDRLPS